MSPLSHEDLLLVILMDGRWHSLHEILRRHPMMVHSRAAGLRAKGYDVQHRCTGKGSIGSEYRLGSLSGRAETRAGASGRAGSPAEPFLPMGLTERDTHAARPLSDRPLNGSPEPQRPGARAAAAGSPGAARRTVEQVAMSSGDPLSGSVPGAAVVPTPLDAAAPAAQLLPRRGAEESQAGQLSLEDAA